LIMQRVWAIQSIFTDDPYAFGGADRTVTSSGGLAFLRAGDTALSLLARADTALYDAKENGRNRIEEERSEVDAWKRELQEATRVSVCLVVRPPWQLQRQGELW